MNVWYRLAYYCTIILSAELYNSMQQQQLLWTNSQRRTEAVDSLTMTATSLSRGGIVVGNEAAPTSMTYDSKRNLSSTTVVIN